MDRLKEEFGGRMRFVHLEFEDPINRAIVRKYAINGFPYVLILDTQGQVVKRRGGNLNPALYRKDVENALGSR